jgi:hypothetical protein
MKRQERHLLETVSVRDPRRLEDKPELRRVWAAYVDYAVELDQLMGVHKYFYQINPVQLAVARADSFVIGFAALAQQLDSGLAVREVVSKNPELQTLFNEASVEDGLLPKSWFALSKGLLRADGLVRLQAGLAYLGVLKAQGRLVVDGQRELAERARSTAIQAQKALGSHADALVDNPLTLFETKAFSAWFPLQKAVANGLGDIRVRDRPYFVALDQLEALRP